jgi:hypothetical protein
MIHDKGIPPELLETYWQDLKSYTIEDIRRAFEYARRELKYFPKPAELLARAKNTSAKRADELAQKETREIGQNWKAAKFQRLTRVRKFDGLWESERSKAMGAVEIFVTKFPRAVRVWMDHGFGGAIVKSQLMRLEEEPVDIAKDLRGMDLPPLGWNEAKHGEAVAWVVSKVERLTMEGENVDSPDLASTARTAGL